MRQSLGYAVTVEPGKSDVEEDTFTCKHCNKVTFITPRQRPEDIGGLCKVCMGLICPACVDKPCVPLERRLEQMEASYHARRSYGI